MMGLIGALLDAWCFALVALRATLAEQSSQARLQASLQTRAIFKK
jgi:hypothetical protein